MNPVAKTARVERNATVEFPFGKKCVAMMVASDPKTKKSYHSISVPAEEAAMTFQMPFVDTAGDAVSEDIQGVRWKVCG
jgi:hypothetical protein